MSSIPTIQDWMSLSDNDLAAYVADKHLSVLMSIDGTRRHYLLSHATPDGKITNFEDYARHSAAAYVRVYDLLFSMGIETIMTPFFYPPNFVRNEKYLHASMAATKHLLFEDPFLNLYQRWNARVRLYGDYDIAPNAAPIQPDLVEIADKLTALSPQGERRLLFGYCAGSFTEEVIFRTATLTGQLGRVPTQEEVAAACFPDGPIGINILIKTGWLRTGMLLPSILDGGRTDLYILQYLGLDIQAQEIRRILYDHLFLRRAGPEDDADYTLDDLTKLEDYYDKCRGVVIGLGYLIGPGLWYTDLANAYSPPRH